MKGRLPTLLLLLLVLLATLSPVRAEKYTAEHDNDDDNADDDDDDDDVYQYHYGGGDEEEDEEDTSSGLTYHQEILQNTRVDFSHTDLTGDASTAAQEALQTLTAHFLSQGRLEELFSKTKTPECRAKIAQHLGYHVMALAKEEPLPFVEIEFTNTCQDEQPWDFDNLPDGVHMGVSNGEVDIDGRISITFLFLMCRCLSPLMSRLFKTERTNWNSTKRPSICLFQPLMSKFAMAFWPTTVPLPPFG
jgi:hypothetical protein